MGYQRNGGDKRGSAATRRARREWMIGLTEDRSLGWAPFGGDGTKVPCVHCGTMLTLLTMECDRIHPGQSYRRTNVQPSCGPCNKDRGQDENWVYSI